MNKFHKIACFLIPILMFLPTIALLVWVQKWWVLLVVFAIALATTFVISKWKPEPWE